jgi:hypothetical protein
MGDFDEKTGYSVIKESMGLSDEDLAPQGGDEADLGDESAGSLDPGGTREPTDSFESRDEVRDAFAASDRQEARAKGQAPRGDPLRATPLKFDPNAVFRQDKRGNLVDSKTGEIIARAGSEARIYQRVHKQASDFVQSAVRHVQNQARDTQTKLQRAVDIGLGFEQELGQLRNAYNQINAHQLEHSQLLEAAQYYKQAITDPVGVLKQLLTRAALQGIDIQQLGMQGGNFDPKAMVDLIRQEINNGLAPVNQFTQTQQQQQYEQQTQQHYLRQAEQQVNDFFRGTPQAVPYMHVFHAVLSQPQFRDMPLSAIWDKLQLHLLRTGQGRQRNGSPANGNGSRSLPRGQGMAPSGSDFGRRSNAGPANPNMSYDAIIREVLGSAGAR